MSDPLIRELDHYVVLEPGRAEQLLSAAETLPSGVVIDTVTKGTGASPKASDTVKVHYRGTLTDGTEFDSSYKRGEPAVFPLNRVIGCWTEGLQKMKTGGKATLICPVDGAISQFGQKLKGGSVGLFYYAGHGMQVRGKNFLIPVDAEIENEASTRSEAVDVDQLLEQLGPARLSMVILDACRNNPFARSFRSAASGLAQMDAPGGTLLAYATAPGKVAADGTAGPNMTANQSFCSLWPN